MSAPQCLPPNTATRKPRHALPPGSTDCHCHVFANPQRYPLVEGRTYTPAPAPLSEYLRMCKAVGLQRTVQVNASVYGFDNSLTLDIISELGQHRARGVAGIQPATSALELDRLHAGGIRGVRLSTKVRGYGGTDLIDTIGRKVAPLGWHLQLHVDGSAELKSLEAMLMKVPAALVFDHLGCVRGREGVDAPGFQVLLRILSERDDCWVKVSSWYGRSDAGPPDYADMKPLAQALVAARPDRVLFGTNWPHPNRFGSAGMPDEGDLVDLFCDWVPDAALRQRILVANPAALYGFPAP
jgi:predicted TIM-barrel fold metal-dependent hydrolase